MGPKLAPYINALRRSILREDVKTLIIAVTAAELIVRFSFAATTMIILPGLATMFNGQTESVLYPSYRNRVVTFENVSYVFFPLLVGFVFLCLISYWVDQERSRRSPDQMKLDFEQAEYDDFTEESTTGEALTKA